MQLMEQPPADTSNPVDAAREAIWRLFQEGYVDEDMATAGLLAVDLGTRRINREGHVHGTRPARPRTRPSDSRLTD
jgi:hypothetical protein